MERYLVTVLILSTIFSGCVSQSDYESIPIGTRTSRRIMIVAAHHVGVELTREISAFKKVDEPRYIVNFEGRTGGGSERTCNAYVHEPAIGQGYVTRWHCRWS
ncbi:uncharacterized protein LOC123539122 [Mercenaria mercenaria]|uniref:uncharacterized protein LOC123539122 n=1 Tax=Mercenaria mercenaria TaxID=6596 RepID=UPI001E1D9C81|nr:uncharacterized protein LOC123539122 [Mercenaria mercenaria]